MRNTNILKVNTTAQARITLYEHLEALRGQVLYYTNLYSCVYRVYIYMDKSGLYRVLTGDYLGEMPDEAIEYGPGS